jgi:hypothetical protein
MRPARSSPISAAYRVPGATDSPGWTGHADLGRDGSGSPTGRTWPGQTGRVGTRSARPIEWDRPGRARRGSATVAGVAAGYSGTPLVRKIGIKEGNRVTLVNAPDGWAVPDLPDDVLVSRTALARSAPDRPARPPSDAPVDPRAEIVLAFVREFAELDRGIGQLADAITPDGALWLAWPRRAGGHVSDITDNRIRDVVLPLGLVDVKVAALDEDWSGLKIVWRKERRAERRARDGD